MTKEEMLIMLEKIKQTTKEMIENASPIRDTEEDQE